MASRGHLFGAFAVAAVMAGMAGDAAAQLISNQPFEFSRRGGGGVGMSPGYRQAIIEEKLFDRRPENLLRDATGFLVEVERGPSRQAFVRRQASPFEPGVGSVRPGGFFTVFGGGAGISVGGVFLGSGFRGAGYGGVSGLEYGAMDGSGTAVSYSSSASTPIDSWISQLYGGHSGAS